MTQPAQPARASAISRDSPSGVADWGVHALPLAARYGRIAEENRGFPALIREDHAISHSQFWAVVNSFACRMRDAGVGEGSLVALNTTDMLTSLATLLATSLLGARFVMATKVLAAAKVVRPTHFFRSPEVVGNKRVDFRLIDDSWIPGPGDPAPFAGFVAGRSLEADWLYVHTSGSTGNPKFVALSERVVLARTAAVARDFPYRATTFATTFAVASRPFFARAIATLLGAGAIIDSQKVELFARFGSNLVCGSPQQAARLVKEVAFKPKLARVEISGAKLPDDVALRLIDNFEEVVDVYGATETNKSFETVLTRDEAGRVRRTGRRLDSEIEIVSPSGKLCAPGEPGIVRVRNGYLVSGYLQAPEATAKCFRDGWFYPGDVAVWGERQELRVIGRDDDVINIGGYKLNAGMVDMLIASVPGIREAICFQNPKPNAVDKVLIFVVFDDDAARANVVDAACEIANARLRLSIGPGSIRPVNVIPRTGEGAPDRAACARIVMQRALA